MRPVEPVEGARKRGITSADQLQVRTEKALPVVVVEGALALSTYDQTQLDGVSKPDCGKTADTAEGKVRDEESALAAAQRARGRRRMLMMRARWGTLAVRLEEKERENRTKTAWRKVGQQTRQQGEVQRRWGETHMLLGVVRRLQWAARWRTAWVKISDAVTANARAEEQLWREGEERKREEEERAQQVRRKQGETNMVRLVRSMAEARWSQEQWCGVVARAQDRVRWLERTTGFRALAWRNEVPLRKKRGGEGSE